MIEFCQAHHTDEDDEIENYDLNEAFDVSSNGITGKASGVLRKGDAMMFNQNIFHRGPRNDGKCWFVFVRLVSPYAGKTLAD